MASLLALPAELRIAILEYVFADEVYGDEFTKDGNGVVYLNEAYRINNHLQALYTCRQLYEDGKVLAWKRTVFIVPNRFTDIPARLSRLQSKQVKAIRNITFVADSRHFRKLIEWQQHPFNIPDLTLDTLTIVLHRSSFWHYLFDFTADIVKVLRNLRGVRRIYIVRNAARVKGSLHAWYNRLVALIIKADHHERYDKAEPDPEKVWWQWSFDGSAQSICLEARPPKPIMDEEAYMQMIKPYMEELKVSVENEEWNPDPRSRYHYY